MRLTQIVTLIAAMSGTSIASAELSGMPDGRAPIDSAKTRVGIEAAYRESSSAEYTGVRIVFADPIAPAALVIDAGRFTTEIDGVAAASSIDAEADEYGLGLYVWLPAPRPDMALALRMSIHQSGSEEITSNLVVGGIRPTSEFERQVWRLALLASPQQPLLDIGLTAWGTLGIRSLKNELSFEINGVSEPRLDVSDRDTVMTVSAGLAMPLLFAHVYVAAEYDGETSVAAGLRIP